MSDAGVVVVGGSLGGLHTAEALRAQGYAGTITVLDAHAEPRYDRPPMSKEYLTGVRDAAGVMLRDPARLAALDVDWRLGVTATGLDLAAREVVTSDVTAVPYRALVIATGVTPAWPAALRAPGALTLRTRQDADRLRARLDPGIRLAIVGAGFIGLEVAAAFAGRGASVHVIEAAGTPLSAHLGPEVGRALQRLHERHGVVFHLGTRAEGVAAAGGQTLVRLSSGAELRADLLLVAVGSVPATGWLVGSGLDTGDGVHCDTALRAAPGVYAVGDVARWPHPLAGDTVRIEHWTNAVEQAGHVARQVAATATAGAPFVPVPYFWSDQYGGRLQAHGFPRAGDDVEVIDGDLGSDHFAVHYRRGGRLTAVAGLSRPRQLLAGRRALAAQLETEVTTHA